MMYALLILGISKNNNKYCKIFLRDKSKNWKQLF